MRILERLLLLHLDVILPLIGIVALSIFGTLGLHCWIESAKEETWKWKSISCSFCQQPLSVFQQILPFYATNCRQCCRPLPWQRLSLFPTLLLLTGCSFFYNSTRSLLWMDVLFVYVLVI